MEFWKCLNEELELPVEHQHTRNKVSEQEGETMFDDTSNYHFVSSQESIQFGFPDTTGKIRQDNRCDQSRYALSNQIGQECYTEVGSGCLDSAAVDLKLGGRDGESSKCVSSSVPMKRSRLTSSYSQAPVCQVYGCNKDLSSYKDYYKRHKVCDAHTKTATVIVKGIEQRFCQQCSRFHLLAEFDDGKRSCRKRLANHNERRRKAPGTRFLRSSSMRTSFLFQEMLPTAIPGPSKPEPGKWFSHIKYEDPALDSNLLLNFHDNISVETIDKNAGIPMPNNQDFSHIPDPSSALSLLSAQSLKASDPSTATLNHHHHHQHNFSSEQGLPEKAVPTTTTVSDESILFNLSSGQGTVVDLLQLSSHLQMVEHKRNLMH